MSKRQRIYSGTAGQNTVIDNGRNVLLEKLYQDGSIALLRSYKLDIERRVEQLKERFEVTTIGTATYGPHVYPIYQISAVRDPTNPFIFFSGIVHGDEEAGGKALLDFFEGPIKDYMDYYNFVAIPCVNPSGYEAGSLQAMNGYFATTRLQKNTGNINHCFDGESDQQEAKIIEDALTHLNRRYLFAFNLHEAPPYYHDDAFTSRDAPKGCWVYETCRDKARRLGRTLTDSLPKHIEPCNWPSIYGDANDGGVVAFSPLTISNSEFRQYYTLDGYMFDNYTDHTFTVETPTGWKLEKRIEAQMHFVTKVLELAKKDRGLGSAEVLSTEGT